MIGFAIFALAGTITLNPTSFNVGGAIIGGSVFGIGMVFAAGCASGTTYRVGEGMMGSLVAAFGLVSGALATKSGLLATLKGWIQSVSLGQLTVFGYYDALLTPVLMIVVGCILAVVVFIFWGLPGFKKKLASDTPLVNFKDPINSIFKKGYPYWVAGILIGIIAIVGFVVSAAGTGGGSVLGITGGWMNANLFFTTNSALAWTGFIILGIIGGAFLAAILSGEFKLRLPKEGKTLLLQFLGGILMGFGAVTAMGCNITNVLGGVPQLSIHSIVVGVFILLGCWLMAYLLFMRKDE